MNNWKGKYHHLAIQSQFLMMFLLLILSFITCYFIGMIPILFSNSTDLSAINAQNVGSFKWLQSWSSIGVFILPSILFVYLTEMKFVISKSFSRNQLAISICAMLFCIPIINYLALWNEAIHLPQFLSGIEDWMRASEAKSAIIMEYFLRMDTYGDLFINLFVIALIPAVGEEFLFRGVIQRGLTKWKNNPHFGIWISAFLFSAFHMQFLGFVPRFLIGGFFGYLFLWSGSIWLPVIAHFINNALAVVLIFTASRNVGTNQLESLGATSEDGTLVLMCCFALAMLLYLLHEIRATKKIPS
jgi:membrane protease YdiL (CAAX protease family)